MSGTAPIPIPVSTFSASDPFCAIFSPIRLDCSCLKFDCGSEGTIPEITVNVPECTVDLFECEKRLDFNPDCIEIDSTIVLSEQVGTCSTLLDGTIKNLICRLVDGAIPEDDAIPSEGSFKFTDTYGVTYIVDFEQFADTMDITFTILDPRVPGEDPTGFVVGTQVFRKGIVSTVRQILRLEDDSVVVVSEGMEQKTDFINTNFVCGDQPSVDDFCYHVDCAVSDDLEIEVISGTGTGST